MPYTRATVTIDGVPGLHQASGPEFLGSTQQLTGDNATGSDVFPLLLNLTGLRCLCTYSSVGAFSNCSDLSTPEAPWPAADNCQWHLTSGGQLVETDISNQNFTCLDRTTTFVSNPDQFWPKVSSINNDFGFDNTLFIKYSYSVVHRHLAFLADAVINSLWPVRISVLRERGGSGGQGRVLIYRKYFGWSGHCLHECRAVYRTGSSYRTVEQSCTELVSAQTEAHTASECVWTFAVDCKPVLVRADNRSLACTNRQNEEDESTDLAETSPANPTTSTAYMEPETSTASIESSAHWPDDNVTDFVTSSPSSDLSNETQSYITLRLFGGGTALSPNLQILFISKIFVAMFAVYDNDLFIDFAFI
uniref:CUB domain-containing protein n=1 Tax=Macrostomum lignano TaxID=282301 RepID=A0A1I8IRL2_9PLAT